MQPQIERLEQGMDLIRSRFPAAPVEQILLFRLIVILGREYSALFDRVLRPRGMNETDFRVLAMIFVQPDGMAHPGDICAGVAQSPANMTRITDNLVARDLITRVPSESDRRRMVLRITPRGERLLEECLPLTSDLVRRAFSSLSEEDIREVIERLKKVAASLEAQCDAPEQG